MKNLSFMTLCLIILTSCGVSQEEYDNLEKKYNELQAQVSKFNTLNQGNGTIAFGGDSVSLLPSAASIAAYRATLGNSGKIDSMSAAHKLYNYKLWRDLADDGRRNYSRTWSQEVYGNLFTWDEFWDFAKYVKDLRKNDPDIDGIRVYAGAAFFEKGFIPDVFLIPTKDGKNLIDLDPDFPKIDSLFSSDETILEFLQDQVTVRSNSDPLFNISKPCPYECD
ncbi:hypothetical protein [Ekhidna sp.]